MKKIKLSFDADSHTYTDDEGSVYTSVTQLIGLISPEYDNEFWSMYRALDHYGHKLRPDLLGRKIWVADAMTGHREYVEYDLATLYSGEIATYQSPQMITAEWKDLARIACDWGNEKHNYLEECIEKFYGKKKVDAPRADVPTLASGDGTFRYRIVSLEELANSPLAETHQSIYQVLHTLIVKGYTLYAEKRVYSYDHKVSGTIDVLAVRGREFYIVDWKTNKDELSFEAGYYKKEWNASRTAKEKTKTWVAKDERFKFPLQSIQFCKGNGYIIQLSLYAYLCELWGLQCKGLILCHIRHKEVKDNKTGAKTKVDIAPRIYNNLAYWKPEMATLLQWHLDENVLKKELAYRPNGIKV